MHASNGHGGRDDGSARDLRVRLCSKKAWCVLDANHEGDCVEVPRKPCPPGEYGPKKGKR